MRKLLITCMTCLLAAGSLAATELKQSEPVQSSLSYVDMGVGPLPIPLPIFGIGYRLQNGHHGFDVNVQAATVVKATGVKASLLYNYYFKPSLSSQFYTGIGVGVGNVFCHGNHLFANPEIVFGKQYKTDAGSTSFFQVEVNFPTFSSHNCGHKPNYFPLVALTYGFCF